MRSTLDLRILIYLQMWSITVPFLGYFILMTTDQNSNEPRHDKTNKMSVRPAKIQISLGIRPVWSENSGCPNKETLGP